MLFRNPEKKLFNNALSNKEFPNELKPADLRPIYKKYDPNKLKTTHLPVYFLESQKFLRKSSMIK